MKEIVDKCSTKGCSVDTGTVIDKRRRSYPGDAANLLI